MRDIANSITIKRLVPEATVTSSPTAVVIDRMGNSNIFESLALGMHVGAGGITFSGTNFIALKLEDSDDGSTYTACVDSTTNPPVQFGASNPVGTNFAQAPDSNGYARFINAAKAAADTDPFKVGYLGNKRYVRATIVFGGTHGSGTLVSLWGVLGDPKSFPAA